MEPGEWGHLVNWNTLEWREPEKRNYGPLRCAVYEHRLHVERAERFEELPRQFLSVGLRGRERDISQIPKELQQLLIDLAYARQSK